MEDSDGCYIVFKNTGIQLTSNEGTGLMMTLCKDPDLRPEPEARTRAVREPLRKQSPPTLLGRLVVPYHPLPDEIRGNIVRRQLDRVARRIAEHHKVPFTYDDAVVELVVSRWAAVESCGGRMTDGIVTNIILPRISEEYLTRTVDGRSLGAITLSVGNGDFSLELA